MNPLVILLILFLTIVSGLLHADAETFPFLDLSDEDELEGEPPLVRQDGKVIQMHSAYRRNIKPKKWLNLFSGLRSPEEK